MPASAFGGLVDNMSINDKKQALNQGGAKPVKAPPLPPPKVEKPDASIFGGKPYISKLDFERGIIKASGTIPGAGGAMYTKQERIKLAKEMGAKFGTFFEKGKFENTKMFRDLSRERYQAKTGEERIKIDRKIRFLEREIKGQGK